MTPRPQPHSLTDDDRYEMLFARNHDSAQNRIETAIFCLTTLVQDDETRKAAVVELNDALAIFKQLRETWNPAARSRR